MKKRYSIKKRPIGLFTPNKYNKKNPATVGGKTKGMVSSPSIILLIPSLLIFTTNFAAKIPRKNVIKIDTVAVFIDISIGDISTLNLLLLSYLE